MSTALGTAVRRAQCLCLSKNLTAANVRYFAIRRRRKIKEEAFGKQHVIMNSELKRRLKGKDEIRLLDDESNPLGIVPFNDAFRIGQERSLDVVLLSDKVNPPTCQIIDAGKFVFEQQKKSAKSKTKSKSVKQKTVRLKVKIGEADLSRNIEKISGFLADGHPVRVTIQLVRNFPAGEQVAESLLRKIEADTCISENTNKTKINSARAFRSIDLLPANVKSSEPAKA